MKRKNFKKLEVSKHSNNSRNEKVVLSITNTDSGRRMKFPNSILVNLGIKEADYKKARLSVQQVDEQTIAFMLPVEGDNSCVLRGSFAKPIIYDSTLSDGILGIVGVKLPKNKTISFYEVNYEPDEDTKGVMAVIPLTDYRLATKEDDTAETPTAQMDAKTESNEATKATADTQEVK